MDVWFEKVNFILGFVVQRITFDLESALQSKVPMKVVLKIDKDVRTSEPFVCSQKISLDFQD